MSKDESNMLEKNMIKDIQQIFNDAKVNVYFLKDKTIIADINVPAREISFDLLERLSLLLNTRKINIVSNTQSCYPHGEDNNCYCGDNQEVKLSIKDIKYPS